MTGLKVIGGTGFINGIVSYVQKGGIVRDTKKRGGNYEKIQN